MFSWKGEKKVGKRKVQNCAAKQWLYDYICHFSCVPQNIYQKTLCGGKWSKNLSDCCTFRASTICLVFHTLYTKALILNATSLYQAWVGTLTLYSSSLGHLGRHRCAVGAGVKHPSTRFPIQIMNAPELQSVLFSDLPTFSKSISPNAASIRPRKTTGRQNICDEREHQKKDFSSCKKQRSIK